MKIFLAGGTGFIGRALAAALTAAGHEVTCAARREDDTACALLVRVNFAQEIDAASWRRHLAGTDVVVNAVGLFRERGACTFDTVHRRAPIAMFQAASEAGVRRIVQISALGADEAAASPFLRSKHAADAFLASLPVDWLIAQPSLVFGAGGASARLFTTLASLPVIPLPGRGDARVQPVHIEDLTAALVRAVEMPAPQRRRVAIVGPEAVSFADFLAAIRRGLGLGRARFVRLPQAWMRGAAVLVALRGDSLVTPEALAMLVRGNVADPQAMRELLGREPKPVHAFIAPAERASELDSARLSWLLPPLRWSIAAVWIVSGIVSLGVYPQSESLALLARVGVEGRFAPAVLYGAALLDIALGIATLLLRHRQWLWLVQVALILGYTTIITLWLPEFWLHPFGPVIKNLPLLAALALLLVLARR